MSRTIDTVKSEYANAAYELGQLSFQLGETEKQASNLEQEIQKRRNLMGHLNKEALKIQKESEIAKLTEEPKETQDGSATEAQ